RPDNIGIQDGVENQYVFDGRQLERWGISQASLPPGSIVRHKTPSLWQLYQWRITGVIAVCVIQGLLITALIIQRYRRARAERCFRQTVDAAHTGMLVVGQGGEIVLVNQQIERLFGHPNEELVGQNVEMLVPERIRREQAILRRVFFAARDPQPMGIKRELFG